jgi:membrane protein DedA with SNARE-associated domain
VTNAVVQHGIYAIFALMAVDAVFPAASELVMVVGGALATSAFAQHVTLFGSTVGKGAPTFVAVALAGTLGYTAGAVVGWLLGRRWGRTLRERPVRWLHLTPERLARSERWFDRWGDAGVLVGRVTPLVRSFVSVPAGVLGMRFGRYLALTLVGSAVWSFALAAAGWAAGGSYHSIDHAWRYVEAAVAASVMVALVQLWRARRPRRPA